MTKVITFKLSVQLLKELHTHVTRAVKYIHLPEATGLSHTGCLNIFICAYGIIKLHP